MGQSLQPEPSGERSGGMKPAEMAEEGSGLERGLHAIVGSFYRYAKGSEGPKELDQAAFQTLLSKELSHQLTNPEDQEAALDMFKKVDANNDQKISFDEYWDLIVEICRVIRRSNYNE
ncbi:fumarate hydratase [Platysternon megacephalum]|uniref:Fumarate hydratase n=1 Tax=Platysternon megacephalum TaxID=55544 RepID=A0A4D9DMD6_9SAUR|nr:fumarate hydratase [Platysternon megacephalum]